MIRARLICLTVLCLLGVAAPARAALIATIQPVNICLDDGTGCAAPSYDAAGVRSFWLTQGGITIDFLPARSFNSTAFRIVETSQEVGDLLSIGPSPDPAAPTSASASPITIWFSDRMNTSLAGLAVTNANRGWVAANLATGLLDAVLAHEIGHIFGLSHDDLAGPGSGNLMLPFIWSTSDLDDVHLSPEQAARARQSRLLVATEIPAPSALLPLLVGIAGLALQRRVAAAVRAPAGGARQQPA